MSTTEATPLLQDALHNFSQLVSALKDELSEWHFLVTGDLGRVRFCLADRLQATGYLSTPFPMLAESRCMAMLSEYGFGFKTKLLDAILAGCYTLVPPKLYGRLPIEIQPFCIVVKLNSAQSFKAALARSRLPMPEADPNGQFKRRAYAALDAVLER